MARAIASEPEWVAPFLHALRRCGVLSRAAREVGKSTGTISGRRRAHPSFDRACREIVSAVRAQAIEDGTAERTLPPWTRRFLETLAETSNVSASAKRAETDPKRVYRLRRDNADFARAWAAALLEGYENLELETLGRLRHGVPADGPKFDLAAALRLLALHRESAARERSRLEHTDEAAVLAALNARLESMRRNEEALQAALTAEGPSPTDRDDAE